MKGTGNNVILIGMAGAGKSTVGKILAGKLAYDFIDTDQLIEQSQNCPLQVIIDQGGLEIFKTIEEKILLSLHATHSVIATGGSSVYSRKGMDHLEKRGCLIHLDVALETLQKRVHNELTRGLVKQPEQSFAELYRERRQLYRERADYTVECTGLTKEQTSMAVIDILRRNNLV